MFACLKLYPPTVTVKRMLANVFSNDTTPPRVNTAEDVPIVGVALSLFFMAAIVALAFVACAAL